MDNNLVPLLVAPYLDDPEDYCNLTSTNRFLYSCRSTVTWSSVLFDHYGPNVFWVRDVFPISRAYPPVLETRPWLGTNWTNGELLMCNLVKRLQERGVKIHKAKVKTIDCGNGDGFEPVILAITLRWMNAFGVLLEADVISITESTWRWKYIAWRAFVLDCPQVAKRMIEEYGGEVDVHYLTAELVRAHAMDSLKYSLETPTVVLMDDIALEAVKSGWNRILGVLVEMGWDCGNTESDWTESPLYEAFSHGNMAAVLFLTEHGASIPSQHAIYVFDTLKNFSGKNFETALSILLNVFGVFPSSQDLCDPESIATRISRRKSITDAIRPLFETRPKVSSLYFKGHFLNIVSSGSIELAELLIDLGADVNYSWHRENALRNAADLQPEAKALQMTRLLLDAGCIIRKHGTAALSSALRSKHPNLVSLLLQKGVRVQQQHLWLTKFLPSCAQRIFKAYGRIPSHVASRLLKHYISSRMSSDETDWNEIYNVIFDVLNPLGAKWEDPRPFEWCCLLYRRNLKPSNIARVLAIVGDQCDVETLINILKRPSEPSLQLRGLKNTDCLRMFVKHCGASLETVDLAPHVRFAGRIKDKEPMSKILDLIKTYVELGSNIHANDEAALTCAVETKVTLIAELLLDLGARPDAAAQSLLRIAISNRDVEMVRLLVTRGARNIGYAGQLNEKRLIEDMFDMGREKRAVRRILRILNDAGFDVAL